MVTGLARRPGKYLRPVHLLGENRGTEASPGHSYPRFFSTTFWWRTWQLGVRPGFSIVAGHGSDTPGTDLGTACSPPPIPRGNIWKAEFPPSCGAPFPSLQSKSSCGCPHRSPVSTNSRMTPMCSQRDNRATWHLQIPR